MSTTIVFACKSNSCRSQIAEGWAHNWIKAERLGLEKRKLQRSGRDQRLRSFLDGLLVVSVALDESSVVANDNHHTMEINSCVTCVGEMCTSSSTRRRPKQKAMEALAIDGVDISNNYYAKTFDDILPLVVNHHHRRQNNMCCLQRSEQLNCRSWKRLLSFAGMYRILEIASREMGMAFAGVAKENDDANKLTEEDDSTNQRPDRKDDETQDIVDNLIVLCSCPDSMKCQYTGMCKAMLEWDIDPPSAMAKSEGDGAYLRVSRQIREKVTLFLEELKNCAMVVDDDDVAAYNMNENST